MTEISFFLWLVLATHESSKHQFRQVYMCWRLLLPHKRPRRLPFALSQRKELGVMVFNCSCLALDLQRVFLFYWQLHDRDYIPSIWSKRVTALYGRHDGLEMLLNSSQAVAYVSVSDSTFNPFLFCSPDWCGLVAVFSWPMSLLCRRLLSASALNIAPKT